jgi:hypothetical protein
LGAAGFGFGVAARVSLRRIGGKFLVGLLEEKETKRVSSKERG